MVVVGLLSQTSPIPRSPDGDNKVSDCIDTKCPPIDILATVLSDFGINFIGCCNDFLKREFDLGSRGIKCK